MNRVFVLGAFDDIRSPDVRFLHEASRLGALNVLLVSDETLAHQGIVPKFSLAERLYFLESIRYVQSVSVVPDLYDEAELFWKALAQNTKKGDLWAVREGVAKKLNPREAELESTLQNFCLENQLTYYVLPSHLLQGFPCEYEYEYKLPREHTIGKKRSSLSVPKKVIVTGSFDWLHSGHVRFFEEAASFGTLTVVVGSDANIRLLKGEGHPLYGEQERRYLVGSIRYVSQALVSTGSGWLDAEPEIRRLRPDIYIVNKDGDRPEKRDFCESQGIAYLVLERSPRQGLPQRTSTSLRGF